MELTKEQTLRLLYETRKYKAFQYKFKFSTKTQIRCLKCGKSIYISYRQFGINAIFCRDCYPSKLNNPSMVQFQYVRIIKEEQIKLINEFNSDKNEESINQ